MYAEIKKVGVASSILVSLRFRKQMGSGEIGIKTNEFQVGRLSTYRFA